MTFKVDHEVFPLHLENHKDLFYSPLKASQRIKYTCFAVSKNYLIFGATSGGLYIFKRHPYTFHQLIPSKESAIRIIAISSSESLIACATSKNIVRVVEVSENYNGKLITRSEELSDFEITALCWTEDNAKPTLFIGDSSGRISHLKLSFLSKSILNIPTTLFMSLDTKIIQLFCENDLLVASTLTRCYICDLTKEHYKQIGQQLRDGMYGVTFLKNRKRIFCARPGSRLWEVDLQGDVHSTHQFKHQLAVPPSTFVTLFDEPKINTGDNSLPRTSAPFNFIKLYDLLGRYIVTYNGSSIYVLNTDTVDVLFWCNCFGSIIDVQCSLNSVFIWNANGDLHEIVFLPIEKYLLTLYLKNHHDLCVQILCVFHQKLISSSELHELYALKDLEWSLQEKCDDNVVLNKQILSEFKEKLKSVASKQMKLDSGIYVVNNKFLSHHLLDDSVVCTHSTSASLAIDSGELRKRSNSLPSNLKNLLQKKPSDTNVTDGFNAQKYDKISAESELYNSPFVTFASYHILRENFSELGANVSQIFNHSSRNLMQKWLNLENKIVSRAEDTTSNVAVAAKNSKYEQYDDVVVEIENEPIVEKRETNSTNATTIPTDELTPFFDVFQSDTSTDVELMDALNAIYQLWCENKSHLTAIMALFPAPVKDVFSSRCFVRSFLSTWFESENFAIHLSLSLSDQYPQMLACLFDEKELQFDLLLSQVLVVFTPLLETRTLLDRIKSFKLPCYYKSFCYVLKHFQKDEPSHYENIESERIDWPVPVYLNTMLLMISVDRKDVFCEMGVKKNVDVLDVLYLLLHAVEIDSKENAVGSSNEPKNLWLNYVQKQQCDRDVDCLDDLDVLRLAVHALVSHSSSLRNQCCSNCWFLLPQTYVDRVEFEPLSRVILKRFWCLFVDLLDRDCIDYATLLSLRRAICDNFKYQSSSYVCYMEMESCEHLLCKTFYEHYNQSLTNGPFVLSFNVICNLCHKVPSLWRYLSELQRSCDRGRLLNMFHVIQLGDMQLLDTLLSSSMTEVKAQTIFDCMASLSEGCCLNCKETVFDNHDDRICWDDMSNFVLQKLGVVQTLKLLRQYSNAKVHLSSSFYQSALLISLPQIKPEFSERLLSIISNHRRISSVSPNILADLNNAYERDNVTKKANRSVAPAFDAHHWGIAVEAEQSNRAICYCCSLPLFSKSLIKEFNAGITVFSCTHTYHTICLRNKNCALTCIVCDRFLR